MDGPRWVPVGKILKTHGIHGAVVVAPYGDTLARRRPGDRLFLQAPRGGVPQGLRIAEKRPLGAAWVIGFEGVEDLSAARRLVGLDVGVPEEDLDPLEDGEYYHHQLVGLAVVTEAGVPLGRVVGVMETKAHDLYAVATDSGREILLPAVEEIIKQIDVARGVMVVDPPEGLLDDL
uniref:Ribosome maturation factor RimM n=1 Tax=Desulfacinum infernum TaxID=35837 RepID=A0A832EIE8_9BACT